MKHYIGFVLLAVIIVALHTYHFRDRPFRQDEAWIVHGALEKASTAEIVQWVSVNIHPPLWVSIADGWVDAFGEDESVVRWLSSLFTLVSLALTYRLAADLFGKSAGLAAVFLLGVSQFFQFYTHEFRPYSALIMWTLALQLTFLRWIRRPDFKHALLFVLSGAGALYTHFFAVYVLAALALFFVIFVRRLYLRAFGLFTAIGLSFLGWLLPFAHAALVTNPGGIEYAWANTWKTLNRLYQWLWLRPHDLVWLLFLIALAIPASRALRHLPSHSSFRFSREYRRWYPFLIPTTVFLLALLVNHFVSNLTPRSLVILIPPMVIFLSYGLMALPRVPRVVFALLLIPGTLTFLDFELTGPHAEVAAFIAPDYHPGSPVIVNVTLVPRQTAVLYYVQRRLGEVVSNDRVWQVLEPDQPYLDFLPYPPQNVMKDTDTETLERLELFIGAKSQVWLVERDKGTRFSKAIKQVLGQRGYEVVQAHLWEGEYRVLEYQRRARVALAQPR
jgi:uncharacterized membrane protein